MRCGPHLAWFSATPHSLWSEPGAHRRARSAGGSCPRCLQVEQGVHVMDAADALSNSLLTFFIPSVLRNQHVTQRRGTNSPGLPVSNYGACVNHWWLHDNLYVHWKDVAPESVTFSLCASLLGTRDCLIGQKSRRRVSVGSPVAEHPVLSDNKINIKKMIKLVANTL